MKISPIPPKKWLEELLEYRPTEGLFWRLRPTTHFNAEVDWYIWNKRFAGKDAGTKPNKLRGGIRRRDHRRVQIPLWIKGPLKTFSVHRIAFAMMGVEVPHGKLIDHKDEDPWNNKWDNLRIATPKQNCQNHKGWRKRKNALPKGVYIDPRRKLPYYSMLKSGNQYKRGKYRASIGEAREDFLRDASEFHGEFFNSGVREHVSP